MISRKTASLCFPSGRKRRVMRSRYDLAKRIITYQGGDYVPLEAPEAMAAASLEKWGMIERHPQAPGHVRWSLLHERPRFSVNRPTYDGFGMPITNISNTQYDILEAVRAAHGKNQPHDVLIRGEKELQRTLRPLVRRGFITAEILGDYGETWSLRVSPEFLKKVVAYSVTQIKKATQRRFVK